MQLSKLNKTLILFILISSFATTIGYSALSASLSVSGDLVYRTPADIRITGVKLSSVTNGGLEQYTPKYTKDTVSLGLKLPNLNSTVVYEVTVTNKSTQKKKISSITNKVVGNTNITYDCSYKLNSVIAANSSIKILFTYKYTGVTTLPSNTIKENTISFTFTDSITLYNKVMADSKEGKYAKEYTGDSSTFTGTQKVYYYYGNALNNNVIFAGYCWKIYRTTDTGGVKLLYNGSPNSQQKCPTGRSYSIGISKFNEGTTSLADVGYMYNKRYAYKEKNLSSEGKAEIPTANLEKVEYLEGMGSSGFSFNSSTKKWTSQAGESNPVLEFYVEKSGEFYIDYSISSDTYSYNYATVYVNDNEILQIEGTKTEKVKLDGLVPYAPVRIEFSNSSPFFESENFFTFSIAKATGSSTDNRWLYGNSFTYSSGNYTLKNSKKMTYSEEGTESTSNHYTCWNTSGTCKSISYIYFVESVASPHIAYYIDLENGTSIETAISEMLHNDNVNTNNSAVKTTIDNWYKNNMTKYTSYLEDTVWCNDRSIKYLEGWNPNGGSNNYNASFGNSSGLSCKNKNDRFTVNVANGNGKLTYPVGLVTIKERDLSSSSNIFADSSQNSYYTITPDKFNNSKQLATGDSEGIQVHSIDRYGSALATNTNYSNSIRPSVSLRSGIEFLEGDGTINSPYVIDAS